MLFSDASHRHIRLRFMALALYAGLIIFSNFYHAPYSDEGDSWVMARDTNFDDFIHYFGYAGHPPLWYIVLLPFARMGLPYETMAVINVLFSVAVAWLILFRSPFALWLKLAFLFSSGISFQYAVFARGYMLMILIMFLIAALYPERMNKPKRYGLLLALLFNTEAFAMVPAAMLSVFFTLECFRQPGWLRRYAPALAIASLGAVIALASLWPPDDIQEQYKGLYVRYPDAFIGLVEQGVFSYGNDLYFYYSSFLQPISQFRLIALGLGAMTWLLTVSLVNRIQWMFFLVSWLGWFCFIVTCKRAGAWYHAWLLPIFLMWTLWLAIDSASPPLACKGYNAMMRKLLTVALAIIFMFSDINAVIFRQIDYKQPLTGGKDMAAFIRASGHDHYRIASLICSITPNISAYLPETDFWILGFGWKRYVMWNQASEVCMQTSLNKITPWLVAQATTTSDMVVLSREKLVPPKDVALHLLHYSPGMLSSFYLYSFSKK